MSSHGTIDEFIAAAICALEVLAADHGLTIAERVTAFAELTWKVQALRDESREGLAIKQMLERGVQ